MSRAFAGDQGRPLSTHPNFVTREGLAQIELELARQQALWDAAETGGDLAAKAGIKPELDYWVSRRATAQVAPAPRDALSVHFGSSVEIIHADGRRQTVRIVGEDEADLAEDTVAYVSPLAQALMGRRPGDRVRLDGDEIEVASIR